MDCKKARTAVSAYMGETLKMIGRNECLPHQILKALAHFEVCTQSECTAANDFLLALLADSKTGHLVSLS
ncbi:MAG: hypothetical protein AAB725_01380 [Patescibacteria group bacterium]